MNLVKALPSLGVMLSLTAAKPPAPILEHRGPWDVHSSDNACMLGRTFGTGDRQTLVAFQPLFNATSGEVFVMTRGSGGQRVGTAAITEQPAERAEAGRVEKVAYFSNVLPGEGKRVTRITIPRSIWDGLDDTDILSIAAPPISVRVKLVRVRAAKAAFAKCEYDTLRDWKVDPAALDPDRSPTPLRNPAWFFSPSDYPLQAIAAGHVGRVVAILNVDMSGAVTGCRIGSSSWPDLNDATCKQARRVKFTPGHDASGRPVAAIFLLPVRWTMPGA